LPRRDGARFQINVREANRNPATLHFLPGTL